MAEVAAVVIPVLFVLGGLVLLTWWITRGPGRRQAHSTGSHAGLLFGLLLFAAFAMGAFLTYALLGAH
jgi:hypothetical protein